MRATQERNYLTLFITDIDFHDDMHISGRCADTHLDANLCKHISILLQLVVGLTVD